MKLSHLLTDKKPLILFAAALLIGILLIAVDSDKKTETKPPADNQENECFDDDNWLSDTEKRITELIDAIDGVSRVRVVLMQDRCLEAVYAEDEDYGGGSISKRQVVTINDGGTERPLSVTKIYPRLRGAAVICKGGANPVIRQKITELLCAVFDLSANRVFVSG